MTGRRIAAFPPRILEDRNPYARLLYRELERVGFETIDASPLKLEWLLRARRHVDILHFHWDPQQKYVQRSPDRVTSLLRRLRQERLVPWWDVVSFVTLLAAARTLGYRLVWTIHEIRPHESDDARHDILASRALARLSNLLLAHDAATGERAREAFGLPGAEVHVVPHGSYVGVYPPGRDRDIVRSELGVAPDAFVFLAFGHLRGYKGFPLLLEAFESSPLPSARLIIAGVPWDAAMRRIVSAAAERDSRIRLMLGPVPVESVDELFKASDAAVFPRGDGWTSGSLILAMSMGIPVIAARQPTYTELMNGEAAGWLFEPGDVSSLKDCLSAAAGDPKRARRKGALALDLARRMSWEQSAAMTGHLIAGTRLTVALAPRIANFMLRTSHSALRSVWALAHYSVMHAVAAYIRLGERGTSVYVKGTFASGDPLFGVSDIDLITVARHDPSHPGRNRERARERWARLCRRIPVLPLLIPHFWVYEDADFVEALSATSLTYGLNGNEPGPPFIGSRPIVDEVGLQDRPGLYPPRKEWRRLAGPERRPHDSPPNDQERRIAAWLELQHWWRYVFKAAANPEARHVPYLCVKFLAEPVRILAWLRRGERIATRVEALRRALQEMPEEEDAFRLGIELERALPRSPAPPLGEVIPAFTRLSRVIAAHISAATETAGYTDVRLLWGDERELALHPKSLSWLKGLAETNGAVVPLPLADWRARVAPDIPDETFVVMVGDATRPSVLAAAARASQAGNTFPVFRTDGLLLLPTLFWLRGTARAVQCESTDPVSMALIEGARVARFPNLAGWSARDSARRATAAHRAWLGTWPGEEAAMVNPLHALGMLFTAARGALFLESVEKSSPELPLTVAAVARCLEQRGSNAGNVAGEAFESFRAGRECRARLPNGLITAFERVVRDLPGFHDARIAS
jgi:glycosyltransferase involved in cell wall biosynthesis/predicted nucleotidyltransferase